MSNKRNSHEVYNRGSDQEIEALFIKNWAEIKRVLRSHMFVKVVHVKRVSK